MAHPETEAQNTDSLINEQPEYESGAVTKALTVESAADELARIFNDDPAEQAIKARKYAEQRKLQSDLKNLKLDENNDLAPENESGEQDDTMTSNYENDLGNDREEFDEDSGTESDETQSAIQAPISWSKEQKKIFETLPPEAQNIIVERERERDKGFQVKATELAQKRRELEQYEQQAIIERQMYAEALSKQLSAHMVEPDVEQLNPHSQNYNPNKYWADKQTYDKLVAQHKFLQQQQEKYDALLDHNAQFAKAEYIKLNHSRLAEQLPEWADDAMRGEIIRFGARHGYAPEDVQTARPEEVMLLSKAMKYDRLMAQIPNIQSQVKKAPKVQKPGAARHGISTKRALADATKKLKRTGSTEDAAIVLSHIMKD